MAPAVSRSHAVAMIETSSGIAASVSSNMMTPAAELLPKFQRVNGSTCFWPESLTAANQLPACSRSKNARIRGLSPLVQFA